MTTLEAALMKVFGLTRAQVIELARTGGRGRLLDFGGMPHLFEECETCYGTGYTNSDEDEDNCGECGTRGFCPVDLSKYKVPTA